MTQCPRHRYSPPISRPARGGTPLRGHHPGLTHRAHRGTRGRHSPGTRRRYWPVEKISPGCWSGCLTLGTPERGAIASGVAVGSVLECMHAGRSLAPQLLHFSAGWGSRPGSPPRCTPKLTRLWVDWRRHRHRADSPAAWTPPSNAVGLLEGLVGGCRSLIACMDYGRIEPVTGTRVRARQKINSQTTAFPNQPVFRGFDALLHLPFSKDHLLTIARAETDHLKVMSTKGRQTSRQAPCSEQPRPIRTYTRPSTNSHSLPTPPRRCVTRATCRAPPIGGVWITTLHWDVPAGSWRGGKCRDHTAELGAGRRRGIRPRVVWMPRTGTRIPHDAPLHHGTGESSDIRHPAVYPSYLKTITRPPLTRADLPHLPPPPFLRSPLTRTPPRTRLPLH